MISQIARLAVVLGTVLLSACFGSPVGERIAVLVEFERPIRIPDQDLLTALDAARGKEQPVNGLERQYLLQSSTQVGAIYLWRDRAAMATFLDSDWHSTLASATGQPALLSYFEVPVQTPGGSADGIGGDSAVTIVRVSAPWYAPRRIIASRMEQSIPTYARIPGLVHKLYTIADGKRVGGIYLWQGTASAQAFFNAKWHQRILDNYGEAADLIYFDATAMAFTKRD